MLPAGTLAMCEPSDVGGIVDSANRGMPTIFLYDRFPGGMGYAVRAVERFGDYGAAVVDGETIWAAAEYIGQTCTLAEYLTDTEDSPLFSRTGACGSMRTPPSSLVASAAGSMLTPAGV